jgi:Methyltransferase domain
MHGSAATPDPAAAGRPPAADADLGRRIVRSNYVADLRTTPPDIFQDVSDADWRALTWPALGRPYQVRNYSSERKHWDREHGAEMPVLVQWQHFNRRFHDLFMTDLDRAPGDGLADLAGAFGSLDVPGLGHVLQDLLHLRIWNYVHRVEDAVWDPRGKRALFDGFDVHRPEILFLGAADGYEAMQLLAMYPGGHAVLVDYDDFCRTDRFGRFPEAYPFLGRNPATGAWRVWHAADMDIDFDVADIRELKYGHEFDIVLSVGLVEHFPDELKPMVFDFHRRFLKPGGYAIVTTPRSQWRSKAFYLAMGEIMNFGYRELMDARQLGLYAYESGFEIARCGYIKAHNAVILKER